MFLAITDTNDHEWILNLDHVVAIETILGPVEKGEDRNTKFLLSTGDTITVQATIESLYKNLTGGDL